LQQAVTWVDRFVNELGRLGTLAEQAMRAVAVTCSLGLALVAAAQTAGTGTAGSASSTSITTHAESAKPSSLSPADRLFLEKAAMAGMAEVELGELAQQKATSIPVRVFGERMVQDHSEANDQLKVIASTKGAQFPAELEEKQKATVQNLQKLSSRDFDREYMKQMVASHEQTVADFKKQAESGNDADLKGFAASSLPKLEGHLKTARSLSEATKTWKR